MSCGCGGSAASYGTPTQQAPAPNGPWWVVYPPRVDGTVPKPVPWPTTWQANSAAAAGGGQILPDAKFREMFPDWTG